MSLETAVATALFVGVTAYALFGGADFGSGWFDLTAGGPVRGAAVRGQIDRSIGPVWEANHVWLIYVLVLAWTAFPVAFAAVMQTLFVPLLLALLGIVLRGASFAFRKYADTITRARMFGAIFAISSVMTPFFLGAVAGAIASGRVPVETLGGRWSSWVAPLPIVTGIVAVGMCAFLAGVFLAADADRGGRGQVAETLRRRTLGVGAATGSVVLVALIPVRHDAPTLWSGFIDRGAALVATSAVSGVLALLLVLRRRWVAARACAVIAVASVVAGWAVAQGSWLLVDHLTIVDAAGHPATLQALLVAVGLAGVLVLPALAYLYLLTQSERWTR